MTEMKNPPYPGAMIADMLRHNNVSKSAAARAFDITRQQLHNLIAGRSGITPEMALRLEQDIGSTADMWLRIQMTYDLAQARKRAIKVKRIQRA